MATAYLASVGPGGPLNVSVASVPVTLSAAPFRIFLNPIGKKYKLSPTKTVTPSSSVETWPSLPVGDFWKFVQVRTTKQGRHRCIQTEYLYCEAWFDAVSAKAKNVTFILSPGHKKVYTGWRPSGIEDGDKEVINKVWEMVNEIIAEVKRVEAKDLLAALPLQFQEIDHEASEIDVLGSVINQMKSDGE